MHFSISDHIRSVFLNTFTCIQIHTSKILKKTINFVKLDRLLHNFLLVKWLPHLYVTSSTNTHPYSSGPFLLFLPSPVSLLQLVFVSNTSPQLSSDDNSGYFFITDVAPIMYIHEYAYITSNIRTYNNT